MAIFDPKATLEMGRFICGDILNEMITYKENPYDYQERPKFFLGRWYANARAHLLTRDIIRDMKSFSDWFDVTDPRSTFDVAEIRSEFNDWLVLNRRKVIRALKYSLKGTPEKDISPEKYFMVLTYGGTL